MTAQTSEAQRRSLALVVVENDGSLERLEAAADDLLARLGG